MSYEYDVFLSYSRRTPVLEWVRDYFKPALEQWLAQSLPLEPVVFRDEEALETGTTWPLALQEGLERSRILVAVLSPSYFRSDWCIAEWTSMRQREAQLGFRAPGNPQGLIYPVTFHDGDHFSEDAKAIKPRDLRRWNRASPAFPQTTDYYDFLGEMQAVADEVAQLISTAPAWQNGFPLLVTPPGTPQPEAVSMTVPRL